MGEYLYAKLLTRLTGAVATGIIMVTCGMAGYSHAKGTPANPEVVRIAVGAAIGVTLLSSVRGAMTFTKQAYDNSLSSGWLEKAVETSAGGVIGSIAGGSSGAFASAVQGAVGYGIGYGIGKLL